MMLLFALDGSLNFQRTWSFNENFGTVNYDWQFFVTPFKAARQCQIDLSPRPEMAML